MFKWVISLFSNQLPPNEVKPRNLYQSHFYSFSVGETVDFCGLLDAKIMEIDPLSYWECENLLPYMEIAYLDKYGRLIQESLTPREVYNKVKKKISKVEQKEDMPKSSQITNMN